MGRNVALPGTTVVPISMVGVHDSVRMVYLIHNII